MQSLLLTHHNGLLEFFRYFSSSNHSMWCSHLPIILESVITKRGYGCALWTVL